MQGRKKVLQNATLRGLRRDNTEGFFHGEGCFHCLNQSWHVERTCTNKVEMCTWEFGFWPGCVGKLA